MTGYPQANGSTTNQRPRATLVIAHPGHELRVHRWLETAQPDVWILTDGSGRTQRSRIDSTTRVLEATGARAGRVYGQMTDIEFYQAVLSADHSRFLEVVEELAAALMREGVDHVAGDAEEGYNPAHDACRLIINAAVRLVKRKTKRPIANYDFTLVGAPGRSPEQPLEHSLWLELDDAAFARKLTAARNYPELQHEVESALNGDDERLRQPPELVARVRADFGVTHVNDFRVECLRPVEADMASRASLNGHVPFYEAYGEKQVRAGSYKQVLRYSEHMVPLAAALDSHVERSS